MKLREIVLLAVVTCSIPVFGGVPVTDGEEALQAKYQPLDKDALVSALHDQDSSVRGLAASLLARQGYVDTVHLIVTALAREPVAGTRISLALSAAQLGSEAGVSYLKDECGGNPNGEPVFRMLAAQVMVDLRDEQCLGDVVDVLATGGDDQAVLQALNLLPRFSHIPDRALLEVRDIASTLLRSGDLIKRVDAGSMLSKLGDSSSVAILKSAIESERDQNAKDCIIKSLATLESRLCSSACEQ